MILGNRQLLSVFFIVVVLLGVFFTMGYIVGRNSGPTTPTEVVAARKESKPITAEPPPPAVESKAPATTETKPQQPETKKESEPERPKAEAPKSESPKFPPMKKEPAPEPAKAKADLPKKLAKQEPLKKIPAAASAPAAPEAPSGGQFFLQLTATSQHEAEVYVDVLKNKGFKAVTSPVPDKASLVRVLVGPMAESAINKARTDLNAAGFPGDKAIKRAH